MKILKDSKAILRIEDIFGQSIKWVMGNWISEVRLADLQVFGEKWNICQENIFSRQPRDNGTQGVGCKSRLSS